MKIFSPMQIAFPAVAACLLLSETSTAATITVNSVTPTLTGNIDSDSASNPYLITQVNPTFAKLSGTGSYFATGPAPSSVTLTVTGVVSDVVLNEEVGIDYDFTFSLSAGSINWTITSEFDLGLGTIPGPSDSGGPITSASSGPITGTKSALAPLSIPSATFTAVITANWTGANEGDTLSFTIPNNSIDFRTGAVPEPSSAFLFALGGLLFFRRKRV